MDSIRFIMNSGPIKKLDIVQLGVGSSLLEHCQGTCLSDTPSETSVCSEQPSLQPQVRSTVLLPRTAIERQGRGVPHDDGTVFGRGTNGHRVVINRSLTCHRSRGISRGPAPPDGRTCGRHGFLSTISKDSEGPAGSTGSSEMTLSIPAGARGPARDGGWR